MPTYEYKCSACNHAFERFHSMSSAPVTKCPECGKKKVKRLLGTGAGLIFKGSGFYITDYRDGGYQDAAKKDTAPAPAASSDAKPATSDGKSAPAAPAATPAATTEKKSSSASSSKKSK